MIIFLAIGTPVFITLGLCSMVLGWIGTGTFFTEIAAQRIFSGVSSSTIMAIPLFMITGELMNSGGISKRLVNFANSLVGWIHGGLSFVVVVTCLFLGAILGSSSACAAMVGAILIPEMVRNGYDRKYTAGLIASAGGLGPIIPPSTTAIVFAVVAEQSVRKLFAGGYIPGLIIGLAFCIYGYYIAKKNHLPAEPKPTFASFGKSFKGAIIPLLLPVIIMGGIISGVFTATESGAVAVLYCLIISVFVYKTIKIKDIPQNLINGTKSASIVLGVMMTASLLSYAMTLSQIPQTATALITSVTSTPVPFLLLVTAILMIAGCFLDGVSCILILTPILMPTVFALGIDPIYFGVFMTICLMVGVLTPPVGLNLYITAKLSDLDILEVAKATAPFILIYLVFIIFSIFVPGVVTWIPNML